ncbi:MAG: zinc ABC transporter ATP-binding protein ZnuC [Proteobacteria bacterium]|nr:zinc ABC transporter ATP-binding protein ZnuC [Pseudomonadota bacterium]MDA0896834.1 zinc ABC transporter ATP-binding protein ZnuC [Pseudomonadota bacterium]MDA1243964.1 zinc ABC transporter ATP-binding protein ZnuC [Pseudomonadota bacterium]
MATGAVSTVEETIGSQQPLLSAVDIGKVFDDRVVLERVSFSIQAGQIVTLIGPNGAGKTTLVRIALGLLDADSGTITRREGLRLGYMPQSLHVEPTLPLTVQRFLALALRGTRESAGGHEIEETLTSLHVPHLVHAQLNSLSGGELQRVLLARALLRKPHLLVLDEPAQGVDIAGQAELYSLIDSIAETQGCGVLMISHDLHLVMSSTDEVICLNHHVCCHGKPETVSNDPTYLSLFGAGVTDSLAVYTHHHTHEHDIHGNVIGEDECNHQ